ncbi:MAG: proline racemase family protein [Deltaproteobacteria bacterium]|nr:proline racemase family protein [Deltaproteobacteria bacterium]
MDIQRATEMLAQRFPSLFATIDSHTAGEPTRLIVEGLGEVPGVDMAEKRRYFMENLDHVRRLLTREPRGHRDMIAAALTGPVSEGAELGLIYMDARRYPYLCGHATIGAVTTLLETGAIEPSGLETTVIVDTPSGPMTTRARVRDGVVESVAVETVPSFVYGRERSLDVPGLGTISVHTVCVGGFFVMVPAEATGISLTPDNSGRLVDLGMDLIDCANKQLDVHHPTRPEVSTVDVVEFYEEDPAHPCSGRSMVIYGERHMDRSPCGTGTAAKLTLLHRQGRIGLDRAYRNMSPLGTVFEARLVRETSLGGVSAVVAEIRGSAQITGIHTFTLDPDDPFPGGFLP